MYIDRDRDIDISLEKIRGLVPHMGQYFGAEISMHQLALRLKTSAKRIQLQY